MSETNTSLEQRIGVGSKLYHLTSAGNLEYIKTSGLKPRSLTSYDMACALNKDSALPRYSALEKYVVCSATEDFSDWKKYGLLDYLIKHVQMFSNKISKLSFVLEDIRGCFVAEHAHLSPKRLIEICGEDLWKRRKNQHIFGSLSQSQQVVWISQNDKYDCSAIPMREYKGDYELPELWIPHFIPFDKITVEDFKWNL
jgi:hypothetical protein